MPTLTFETKKMRAAAIGEDAAIPDLLGEVVLQNNLKFDLGEEEEIYEGFGQYKTSYPYRQQNAYTRELTERDVKTAVLENDYLKAVFLIEYGGRLWELRDKQTGKNLLYTNDVLRFSNLAICNAWFSGGVEWNCGIIGHHPLTCRPVYAAEAAADDGSPILRLYEYERVRRVTWQIDFWLGEKDRFLNCRMRISNESADVIPMYWWSNIAVPEHEGGRVIVPAEAAYTGRNGAIRRVDIPMVDGIDVTDYGKIPISVDYFFAIPKNAPKYVANVDAEGFGLLQMSTSRLQGRKLFSWGHQNSSDRWQEFLTDRAGRYVEIQAGLPKTQYGCIPMAPHTTWEWLERYGALQIPKEELAKTHKERSEKLTEKLLASGVFAEMEEQLAKTKPAALTPAKVVQEGSAFGVWGEHKKSTAHLAFAEPTEAMKNWQAFFDGGKFPQADPAKRPDLFFIDEHTAGFLEERMEENAGNWYAHYHMGLGYYMTGAYEKAIKEFETSIALAENAWAYHGLACALLSQKKDAGAAEAMTRGFSMEGIDISYRKESFKIWNLCRAWADMVSAFEAMPEECKKAGMLRYYYICALKETGRAKEALALLEQDGGLIIEDIREGEGSMQKLWEELHEEVYGFHASAPHIYRFRAAVKEEE